MLFEVRCKTVLGYSDSNQEWQDQNLQCYHYTISQCEKSLSVFAVQSYFFFYFGQ